MYIYGSFINKIDEEITVRVVTNNDTSSTLEIGADGGDLYFSDDPVEITSQVNDTFDHILRSQATIRLLCKSFVPDFYAASCLKAAVAIERGDELLFAGFIEPQTFSQGYNEEYDEVELTCIDELSALKYVSYLDMQGDSYALAKKQAKTLSLAEVLQNCLGYVQNQSSSVMDYVNASYSSSFYIDNSKVYVGGRNGSDSTDTALANTGIDTVLFYGDDEDDVWTLEDIFEESLKYLNLFIVETGRECCVLSWEKLAQDSDGNIAFFGTDGSFKKNERRTDRTIATNLVADCDTQISITSTYNRIVLTDDVTEVENVVESPLDDKSLSAAGNFQKFMTEYISEGEGQKAFMGMKDMMLKGTSGYESASTVDWFMWPKAVSNWVFYGGATRKSIYDQYPVDGSNQQNILAKGMTSGIGACVCAFGKIEHKNAKGDNSPVTSVSMENYLVISTRGDDGTNPTADALLAACPVAEYTGNVSGGAFSPADDSTVNYIVVSGKMVLNPIMKATGTYKEMTVADNWSGTSIAKFLGNTVPSRNNSDGRYYTRKYWKAAKWNDEPTADDDANAATAANSFYPFTGTGPQDYEYKYSAVNQETDTIKKVGLLACMLVIGDKCVVEKQKGEDLGTGVAGTGNGEPEDYVWMDYKKRADCESDDEYYQQCFTIGIDPKLGDKILGTEFDIQKNAPYTLGISADGTAIPIRKADMVSGEVDFKILGPVNAEWNQVTRRHPSFWRHTKWSSESVALLSKTNSIMIKDFKVEAVSDNGKIGAVGDEKDIVYMSDTRDGFCNVKDDIEFKFTTALTSAECKQLGVNNSVKLSSPTVPGGDALTQVYASVSGETAKPEQLFVDAVYREWSVPRIIVQQNFLEEGWKVSQFDRFLYPSFGKKFFVQGISRNLGDGTAQVTLKECF